MGGMIAPLFCYRRKLPFEGVEMVSDTEWRAQPMIECRAGFLLGCSRTRAA
jgi:hypothetical protein